MAPYEIASKAGFDFPMITYRILYTDSQELKGKLNTTSVLKRLQLNMVAEVTNFASNVILVKSYLFMKWKIPKWNLAGVVNYFYLALICRKVIFI